MHLKKPRTPFLGSRQAASPKDADVALFGAPHGTFYRSIDNRPYETAPNALRRALQADKTFLDSWDFDFGGPLLGKANIVSPILATSRRNRSRPPKIAG